MVHDSELTTILVPGLISPREDIKLDLSFNNNFELDCRRSRSEQASPYQHSLELDNCENERRTLDARGEPKRPY